MPPDSEQPTHLGGRPLPVGVHPRALQMTDARGVFEVMAAEQQMLLGRVEIEEEDIVADWQRPSFDVPASTMGVFEGERMVGYAEVSGAGRGDAAVHPAWHGRGIGSALAAWMQSSGRERGATEVGMPVLEGSPADRLLDALGYRVGYTSWLLSMPDGVEIPARALPSEYTIRDARESDLPTVHQVLEDAFLEWARRDREPFADFLAETVQRQGFQPWNIRVVTGPDDQIVAAVIVLLSQDGAEAFVPRLATRSDQRGRGLAQALLVDAFGLGRWHGATSFSLSTDTRTGALNLYRKVGMVIDSVWLFRTIAV